MKIWKDISFQKKITKKVKKTKQKNLKKNKPKITGRQLDDKKWTSEMASTDEDMGGYFFLQLFTERKSPFTSINNKKV